MFNKVTIEDSMVPSLWVSFVLLFSLLYTLLLGASWSPLLCAGFSGSIGGFELFSACWSGCCSLTHSPFLIQYLNWALLINHESYQTDINTLQSFHIVVLYYLRKTWKRSRSGELMDMYTLLRLYPPNVLV